MTNEENIGNWDICIFLAKRYLKVLISSSNSSSTRHKIFQKLYSYRQVDEKLTHIAIHKLLVVSGNRNSTARIFDKAIGCYNKKRMVEALDKIDSSENSVKKFEIFSNDVENFLTKGIENFISQNTRGFFVRFSIPTDFLQKDPLEWEDDSSYRIELEIVEKQAVNDFDERGMKLKKTIIKPFQDAKKMRNNLSGKCFQNI